MLAPMPLEGEGRGEGVILFKGLRVSQELMNHSLGITFGCGMTLLEQQFLRY